MSSPAPAPAIELDEIDRTIVDLLRDNARRRLADIGQHVNLSISAVKRRIDRLEATGVITGYTAVVDHSKLGRRLEAFTELRFAGDTKVADIAGVARGLPEVQAVFTTAGDPDALVLDPRARRRRPHAGHRPAAPQRRRDRHQDADGARHLDGRLLGSRRDRLTETGCAALTAPGAR